MPSSPSPADSRSESPDPASHARNIYNSIGTGGESLEDEDDDDMDFEPATEGSDDVDLVGSTEDDETDFHDAEDGLSGMEIDLSIEEADSETNNEDGGETETERGQQQQPPRGYHRIQVLPNQLMQLLGHAGLRQLLAEHTTAGSGIALDPDSDEDEGMRRSGGRRPRRARGGNGRKFPPVPNEEGRKLMDGGVFGASQDYRDKSRKRNENLARKLMMRELGAENNSRARPAGTISQDLIPSTAADKIIHYDSRCYSGQFSDDGNFFFSCSQDFNVRMYDTSNPFEWKYYKTVHYPYGRWTITDASLSPDNKLLAYSSIRNVVCLAPTDPNENNEPWLLDFAATGSSRSRRGRWDEEGEFGIWSIRFSGDGREIVAGAGNNSLYVYDIETRQTVLKIKGHNGDVNAVCFGDTSSPHILYSGSDDTLVKVWDRRSMGDSREAGVFMGHTEGLTYVDSKGDGRYVLSNGKDQTMKLWDLRTMMSTEKSATLDPSRYSTDFDYRFTPYSEEDAIPHPHDGSVVTFRGHSVLKTLIRCHFSPPSSTNSRYVYTGSADGTVWIFNLDGTPAGKIDVNQATNKSRPRDPNLMHSAFIMDSRHDRKMWETCVRDVSWHPHAPMIAATSWNGWGMATGTCTTHTWNDGAEADEGEPGTGFRVNEELIADKRLYQAAPPSQYRRGLFSRRVHVGGDVDEDSEEW